MEDKMANTTKKTTTKSTTKSTKSTQKRSSGSFWGLNKISFYTIAVVAIAYLISMVLSLCGTNFKIVTAVQNFATAVLICIVAYLAWKYVRPKQTVWKVLYFVLLLVLLIAIIIPLVK